MSTGWPGLRPSLWLHLVTILYTRRYLQANLDELERRASDPARLDEEAQRASEQTQQAEARNEVGVYVYPPAALHPAPPRPGLRL